MIRSPALLSLQASLLAAMGLAACSGNVVGQSGGAGGSGAGTTTTGTGTGASTATCAGAVPVTIAEAPTPASPAVRTGPSTAKSR